MPDSSERLRVIERQLAEISTDMKYVKGHIDDTARFVAEVKAGERLFPQCKQYGKDIADIQGKLAAHKGFRNSLAMSGLGAMVALAAKALWDKILS